MSPAWPRHLSGKVVAGHATEPEPCSCRRPPTPASLASPLCSVSSALGLYPHLPPVPRYCAGYPLVASPTTPAPLTSQLYVACVTDIDEYAKLLGMDLVADKEFMWVAREGLKAPLPDSWKPWCVCAACAACAARWTTHIFLRHRRSRQVSRRAGELACSMCAHTPSCRSLATPWRCA